MHTQTINNPVKVILYAWIGKGANRRCLMSRSSLRCSSLPSRVLLQHKWGGPKVHCPCSQLPLCWSVFHPINSRIAWWLEPSSCGSDKRYRLQGQRLGIPPSRLPLTFSKGHLSRCAVGMPGFGLSGFLFNHLRWMGPFGILSLLLLFCPVYYCITYYLAY